MYSPEEIKVALRKYIASTGDTSIDEQSIINILDQGADRDFNMVAPTIKSIRENYGVKKSIPMWLRMLTFRLIYDCMASDADCNSEVTWYRLLGYENKIRELFCNIGVNQNIQNMLLSAKGDKIKIDTILLDMVLGKESSQIIKELQKNNIKDSIKEKLNEIGIAQDVQDMLWEVQAQRGSTKEKQIKETLIKSALGSDYEQVYNLLLSQAKSQENLLKALGFNKKVFDSTSSWQMYSPEMKLRQSRFKPVNLPFSYAEVESNPIYIAMLHHLISEARVLTNSFVDVFGKMGYIPAFCAEGYAHRLIFTNESDSYLKYYHGITDRPTKTYRELQKYMYYVYEIIEKKLDEKQRDQEIRGIVSDASLMRGLYSQDLSVYAAAKFCDMCFRKPYWENRNVESHIVETKKKKNFGGKVFEITDRNVKKDKDRMIIDDYSSVAKAKEFVCVLKESFTAYAQALKKVEYVDKSDAIVSFFIHNLDQYDKCLERSIDYDYYGKLYQELKEVAYHEKPLLYVDAPKYGEYKRFSFDSVKYMGILESLLLYDGDWILTFKRYNSSREYTDDERYALNDFEERVKASERPLFEYKFLTNDRNVRNSISFITTIDFDELTAPEFKSKYNIKLKTNDTFKKLKVN